MAQTARAPRGVCRQAGSAEEATCRWPTPRPGRSFVYDPAKGDPKKRRQHRPDLAGKVKGEDATRRWSTTGTTATFDQGRARTCRDQLGQLRHRCRLQSPLPRRTRTRRSYVSALNRIWSAGPERDPGLADGRPRSHPGQRQRRLLRPRRPRVHRQVSSPRPTTSPMRCSKRACATSSTAARCSAPAPSATGAATQPRCAGVSCRGRRRDPQRPPAATCC